MTGARLQGLGIVITRPRAAAEALAAALEREGARAFVFPALAIEPLPPSPALEAALAQLEGAALAIFVSANAAEHGMAAVRARGSWPGAVPVAAVGDATAEALRAAGIREVVAPPDRHDSEGLLALPQLAAEAVRGRRIVIFRGEGGRERLRDALQSRGAQVTYAECYRRARPQLDPAPLLAAWARGEVHAVSALSGETLENFVGALGEPAAGYLSRTLLAVPHEAIAAHPAARRFGRVIVCGHGADALAEALSKQRVAP